MKFISWNVNGLRAIVKKGFADIFEALDADFFCLQEIKPRLPIEIIPTITFIISTLNNR